MPCCRRGRSQYGSSHSIQIRDGYNDGYVRNGYVYQDVFMEMHRFGDTAHNGRVWIDGPGGGPGVSSVNEIFIDGTSIGSGEAYDSVGASAQGVLAVSPGTHLVEVMKSGQVLYQRKVFLGTGVTTSITLP